MDQNTRKWFNKMNAISKAKGPAAVEDALSKARAMEDDDNDLLLPPRVFGFALNRKEWCQFSLDKIQRSVHLRVKDAGADVDGLVFPPVVSLDERRDIFKLVSGHRKVMNHAARLGDTINGKGESLILLFHGRLQILFNC
jgi:hypothetical protein